eukprot:scaffold442409_cov37-Prasinocladus_malaysianus.AAC.1
MQNRTARHEFGKSPSRSPFEAGPPKARAKAANKKQRGDGCMVKIESVLPSETTDTNFPVWLGSTAVETELPTKITARHPIDNQQ